MNDTERSTHDPAPNSTVALVQRVGESEDERIALYTNVIAPGAPPAMVALVYHYATMLDLDPLRRDVMLISFDRKEYTQDSAGNKTERWVKDYAVIISVHGMLKKVGRAADYGGILTGVVYPGDNCRISADGTVSHEYDVVQRAAAQKANPPVMPVGAYATVLRNTHGQLVRITSYVPFEQCAQYTVEMKWDPAQKKKVPAGRKLRAVWATRPDWMIEKCAIAFSCRKAYDHVLGRVYVPEEVGLVSGAKAIEVPAGSHDASEAVVMDPDDMANAIAQRDAGEETQVVQHVNSAGDPELFATATGSSWTGVAEGDAPEPENVDAETMHDRRERFLRKARWGERLFDGKRRFVQRQADGADVITDSALCGAITGNANLSVALDDLEYADLLKGILAMNEEFRKKEARVHG